MSSSIISFIKKHAKTARTTVTIEQGVTLRLDGLPAAYTTTSMRTLAASQPGDVRGAIRTALEEGKKTSSSITLEGERAGALIAGSTESRAGRRQTAMSNSEPVAASSNGSAS
jgi:hypothetical protein